VLQDPTVSRFHCELKIETQEVVVQDLSSRNGTLVDGLSVIAARLTRDAVLTLGNTELMFELGSAKVSVELSEKHRFGSLVGRSKAMRAAVCAR